MKGVVCTQMDSSCCSMEAFSEDSEESWYPKAFHFAFLKPSWV
jgi:hypothetical protein